MYDLLVIGGGAAGFYGAIHASIADPTLTIAIFERGKNVLGKVKISGGGRCNVTHAAYDPLELSKNYPRGHKELLGPFYSHGPSDTVNFFEESGVPTKVEDDGRIFPVSNSSQSIIDCFLKETKERAISILLNRSVKHIQPLDEGSDSWHVGTADGAWYQAKKLLIATGSNSKIWKLLEDLGHTVVSPVPSLFTFNCPDKRIQGLQGLGTRARVTLVPESSGKALAAGRKKGRQGPLSFEGPLLVTHWGFSGPAILKLSAWAARVLCEWQYVFEIQINWVPNHDRDHLATLLLRAKQEMPRKLVVKSKAIALPSRLWARLVAAAHISPTLKWAEISKVQLQALADQLTQGVFKIEGKSTFKEEFVTAGGVHLKEIDFRTFESKICPNLYLAGEVLNVDAITGGFNFQNAWTGAYLAAQAIAQGDSSHQ